MEELRKIVQEFQALLKSPGWDRLVEYGEAQIAGREGSKVMPAHSLDAMIANATTDAEVSGIRLFLKLPELAISDFESQLDELKEEVRDGESSN
jgi:hypothetical protein